MDNNKIRSMLQDVLEERIPSLQVDLWPAVKVSLVEGRHPWIRQREKMDTTKLRPVQRMALGILLVVALLAVAFSTPQGRAWAQEILLHFFIRANSDVLPVQPFQLTPIPEITTPDPGYVFNKDVVEAGRRAGFAVLVPASLPETLSFEGASYEPEHNIVRISYRYNQDAGPGTERLVLREERLQTNDDCELCGMVGASAEVEEAQVGDVTGEYVEGVWKLTDNGPVWESDPYAKTLRFQKNGVAFELFYMGMAIDKEALIAIAASLK